MFLTEEQIERYVEREMNLLDRAFLNGEIEVDQYDSEVKALDTWSREEYAYLRRNRDENI